MTLYFMRHAQTDYNKKNLWMGLLDPPLNDEGALQAKSIADSLSTTKISIIYSSPLIRAIQTAHHIQKKQIFHPPIIIMDGLKERGFGIFEGTAKTKESREGLKTHSTVENKVNLIKRVKRSVSDIEISLESKFPGETVLIISHSNVFRAVMEDLGYTTTPPMKSIRNAEYIEIRKPNCHQNAQHQT